MRKSTKRKIRRAMTQAVIGAFAGAFLALAIATAAFAHGENHLATSLLQIAMSVFALAAVTDVATDGILKYIF